MKAIRWIVLAIVALGAAGWMLAQAEVGKGNDGDSEVRVLRQQVEQLQARLKTLEERVAKAESAKQPESPRIEILPRSPVSPPVHQVPSLPGLLGKSQSKPKIWGEREVNGWTFYTIPCGE